MLFRLFQDAAKIIRGYPHHQYVRTCYCLAYLRGRGQRRGQFDTREIFAVAMILVNVADGLRIPGPQFDRGVARYQGRYGGAP